MGFFTKASKEEETKGDHQQAAYEPADNVTDEDDEDDKAIKCHKSSGSDKDSLTK